MDAYEQTLYEQLKDRIDTINYANEQIRKTRAVPEEESLLLDHSILAMNLDNIKMPSFEAESLAIRELGNITIGKLFELVGAIQGVGITRTYNKQNPAPNADLFTSRRVKWDEVKQYAINQDNVNTLFAKSIIKQYLLYCMLPLDNEGTLFDVPTKAIADYLHISTRTVQNNNRVLQEAGFIRFDKDKWGRFSYAIQNYKQPNEQGGYIKLSKPAFLAMLEIDDVNTLRFGMRLYARFVREMARDVSVRPEMPAYTIDELRSILPRYKTTKNELEVMLEKLQDVFVSKMSGDKVFFYVNEDYEQTAHAKRIHDEANQVVVALLQDEKVEFLTKTDRDDIKQLINQFGRNKIYATIQFIVHTPTFVQNINNHKHPIGKTIRYFASMQRIQTSLLH